MRLILSIILALAAAFSYAADFARIDIVIPEKNVNREQLSASIQNEIQKQFPDFSIKVRTDGDSGAATSAKTLLINVGDQFLPWVYSSKNHYAATINFYVNSLSSIPEKTGDAKITSLYRDQPFNRQLQLARFLLPNLKKIAVLYGEENQLSVLKTTNPPKLEFDYLHFESKSDWAKEFSELIRRNDALLAIEDPTIYNSESIRSILLTAYRHGKTMLGPNRAFVNAGSLASCYTLPDEYLQQLTAMIKFRIQQGRLPEAQYPRVFHVTVNQQVSSSLNLIIPDEKAISAWVQSEIGECSDGC